MWFNGKKLSPEDEVLYWKNREFSDILNKSMAMDPDNWEYQETGIGKSWSYKGELKNIPRSFEWIRTVPFD